MNFVLLFFSVMLSSTSLAGSFQPSKDKSIVIQGPIDLSSATLSNKIMSLADGSGDNIDLIINSPGGHVAVGYAIVQAMSIAKHRGHTVRCVVVSYAASMAFTILAHCSERYALQQAKMLYHPPRIFAMGVITHDLASLLSEELSKLSSEIVEELLALYPVNRDHFYKHYARESWHSGADLNAALGGNRTWITIVDDIEGLKLLVDSVGDAENKVNYNQILYEYTAPANRLRVAQ